MTDVRAITDRRTTLDLGLPCRLWEGTVTGQGYGQLVIDGKPLYVHRVTYQLHVGPLNRGQQVDHACHNAAFDAGTCSGGLACLHRRCWEPAHLDAVSTAENSARGGHPLYVVARQQMCRKGLHDLTDPANRKTRKDGRSRCRPCDNEGARRRWATT